MTGHVARFAVADELTCYYDQPSEPANVHVEARVAGALDEARVRAAVKALLGAEPGLRARQAATGVWRTSFYWEFPAAPDVDPVEVARFADESELAELRSAFLSRSPSLRTSPPFLLLLAAGPGGDALMLNAHHACFDGLSALRLLRRIADEYGGSSQAPARSRDVPRATATAAAAPPPRMRSGRITRIAPAIERSAPGYGVLQMTWEGLPSVAGQLKAAGYSVNDLLVSALAVAIGEWNAAQGARSGLIQITMPVGDPVQATEAGEWANRSRLTKVTVRPPAGATAAGLLPDVAAQTRYAKNHDSGQVDVLSRALTLAPVPVFAKRLSLRAGLRVAGIICCDTSLISNLGMITPVRFGTAGDGHVCFSTSAHMPRGLSLGVVTTGDRPVLTFRYRRALFSPEAAAGFAATYLRVLDEGFPR